MKYIAYGSNMNTEQMFRRCPNARVVCSTMLIGWRLEFRYVATLVKRAGARVPCVLWEITDECEAALDAYEGYPRLYRKDVIEVPVDAELFGREAVPAMVYLMNGGSIYPPSLGYYDVIRQGYADFDLNVRYLDEAVRRARRAAERR